MPLGKVPRTFLPRQIFTFAAIGRFTKQKHSGNLGNSKRKRFTGKLHSMRLRNQQRKRFTGKMHSMRLRNPQRKRFTGRLSLHAKGSQANCTRCDSIHHQSIRPSIPTSPSTHSPIYTSIQSSSHTHTYNQHPYNRSGINRSMRTRFLKNPKC